MSYSPQRYKESDTTDGLTLSITISNLTIKSVSSAH